MLKKGATNTVITEKKRLKNNGIIIKAKGIKYLKLSSKVNEFVIQ